MEITGVAVLILVMLVPSVGKLIESMAYRNRAQGKAAVLRAQLAQSTRKRGSVDAGRRQGRDDG